MSKSWGTLARHSAALLLALVVGAVAVVVPPAPNASAIPPPTPLTFGGTRMDAAVWSSRQDAFLAFATASPMVNGNKNSILAHAERNRRDNTHAFDGTAPQPSDFAAEFQKLREFRDTGDFNVAAFLPIWYGFREQLDPDTRAAWEERLLAFKYWWTEPTPPGITDSQYYWTENHQILFLTNEYLVGQAFPNRTFTNDGRTGAQHMAHAEPLIRKWLGLRARFGFSEWLSNVYYGEDLEALLNLAEFSDNPDLARHAAMMLDVMFVEIASHLQNGAFGATHGRSYMKDKMTARDEDTFTLQQLVFNDTPIGFAKNDVAVAFAVATRYVPPQAAINIAKSTEVGTVRQRASLPVPTKTPVVANPAPAAGQPYDDLMVWWGIGAQFAWPVVPLSIETINAYDLWDTDNFQQAAALRPIADASTIPQLQDLSAALGQQINAGLLSEVHTNTWRSPEVMLSTAQDWRPGEYSEQVHIWQATIDADAQVFTQLPNQPLPLTTDWFTNSGYWSGEGATPRSAQFERVNVSIYAPAFVDQDEGPLTRLGYEDFTHAYFPTEHFDEVVEVDNWVIGRKGDGYVALWSWRDTQWRVYNPATEPTRGLTERFDLLAPGGPDNVWVTEVGRAADFAGSPDPFGAFVAAITAAVPAVTPRAVDGQAHTLSDGFDVAYNSPQQGALSFGTVAPFTVAGNAIDLHPEDHWSSPWSTVGWDQWRYQVSADGASLDLDFSAVAALTVVEVPPNAPVPTTVPGNLPLATPAFTG